MKKLYESPEMEVIDLNSQDVIVTSGEHDEAEGQNPFLSSDNYSYETYGLDDLTGF